MEPFGLFDLLKTLLPDPPKKEETQAQNPAPPPQKSPVSPPENIAYPHQNNVCWEFMTKHDERVKNTKKK